MRLYLASTSPARLATLRAVGIEPVAIPSHVDEEAAVAQAGALTPPDLVMLLARLKAEGQIVSDTQALGQLVEQISMTLLFSLDYQRILGRKGQSEVVVYQIMMLVAPHLIPASRDAAQQLAMHYLEA